MNEQTGGRDTGGRRYRPARRPQPREEETLPTLTADLMGLAVAYANTLLFVGFEIGGLVEITVYPRYRFPSDDRVQGQLGYVRVPPGTAWEEILSLVDAVWAKAQQNYNVAIALRSQEMRAHGASYEQAYSEITDIFRESWHGFSLRLDRDGKITREGVVFSGRPPSPVLVESRGKTFTLQVFSTGSILLMTGDRRTFPGLEQKAASP